MFGRTTKRLMGFRSDSLDGSRRSANKH